ncbi:MAG TPA: DUF3126 family protein [Acetobacteraceae bacterium]|nr:DUF3126 family protein [Acetobacteraceae bacterium]
MQSADITRVQAYLRKTFGTDRIHIDPPKTRSGPVEVRVGDEFIGTLHRDTEDGEVSFSLHIMILEEDLPPVPAAVAPPPRRR